MLFVSLVDCWRSQKNSSLILQLYFQAQIKPCTHHWPPSEKSSSNWLIHSYSAIHGISTSMFASKCCIRLASASQPGSFSPPRLGEQSLNAFTYLLSLHLTTLIQSVCIDRTNSWRRILLQHWLDCCMNGELSEMALSHPHRLLIMSIFFSLRMFVMRQPFYLPIWNDRGCCFECVGPKWCIPTFVEGLAWQVIADHACCLLNLCLLVHFD